MASANTASSKVAECPEGYKTVTGKTSVPGIEIDLDDLQKLYPQYGCRVRIIIMDDGARSASAPPPDSKEYCLHVPPKSAGGGNR